MDNGGGGSAAPTGCYKCGRPGHWSRDCPSNPNQNPNPSSSNYPKPNSSNFKSTGDGTVEGGSKPLQKSTEKPKKVPRSRPKLTPDLLLSNDGIGYVLRHFPRAFKYRDRGQEVSDLGNLIGLYAEWHSHLLPYYSFDQFVHKVEQVGATRRVKTCLGGLRDRVGNGGDPTKLHEPPAEHNISNADEDMNIEEPSLVQQGTSLKNHCTDDFQEDMLQEIYEQGTDELSPAIRSDAVATDHISSRHRSMDDISNQANETRDSITREIQVSEEQKARMEANRLKALEKAAARARSSQTA
ncbi:hypothetical protein RHGRI_026414 [Rhododendron griersonianum]|uniref:CCHC-type domain-containing protein n=1 Tax=Rhododendron griersonianum TaxID=479676 RepID=A0AAV6IW95_9ERIC|nr:hypothetical protein RHGRI_026414 [Rhododendron griersonianum]